MKVFVVYLDYPDQRIRVVKQICITEDVANSYVANHLQDNPWLEAKDFDVEQYEVNEG